MGNELITGAAVWPRLTAAVKSSKRKSFVAVAYFGKGGADRLPLIEGSKLAVDASDHAVMNGQTHPDDLLTLYNKGVEIYTCERLHAKLYIVGSTLFIGSANVSANSADKLKEVLLQTADKEVVKDAKEYILTLCNSENEVGPGLLEELQKIYKPPIVQGYKEATNHKADCFANNPNYFIYRVEYQEATDYELQQEAAGMKEASKRRINKTRHVVDKIHRANKLPFEPNDMVFQIAEEGGIEYIYPAGRVIYLKKDGRERILYLERPASGKKSIDKISKRLSKGTLRKLDRSSKIDKSLADRISVLLK